MDGLILIDKPLNWTSFDVVAKIRGIIKSETGLKIKVGHSGTLDPMATGLLIIAIGSHTKKLPGLIKKDKTYEVEMCLGSVSSTGDSEGEIKERSNIKPDQNQVEQVLVKFTGKIEQIPPRYSAIKINGQRAYNLARSGQEFVIEPRTVEIKYISLTGYDYPIARIKTQVSSGTYIRTLVEDIGDELGCGAYTKALRRTSISNYKVEDSCSLQSINYAKLKTHLLTLDK